MKFGELLQKSVAVPEFKDKVGNTIDPNDIKRDTEALKKLMSREGGAYSVPMKEALGAADASILFKIVIDDRLQTPVEPTLDVSSQIAKVISNPEGRLFVFPTIGAIQAYELTEMGDWKDDTPGFIESVTEVRAKKYGVQIPVSQDLVKDSQWNLLGLLLDAGRNAMARKREEDCFNELSTNGTVVFDNNLGHAAPNYSDAQKLKAQTTGRNESGLYNGTLAHYDLVEAIGLMMANGFNPTDIVVHPLMWTVFAKDPILRFLMLQSGQLTPAQSDLGPQGIARTLPWAFNVLVSPHVPYSASTSATIFTSSSDTTGTTNTAPSVEMFIVDRNASLVIIEVEPLSVGEFQDPYRDITNLRLKERRGIGTMNTGKSTMVFKNILLQTNAEPVFTVRTLSS